jgi:hypothetical protein
MDFDGRFFESVISEWEVYLCETARIKGEVSSKARALEYSRVDSVIPRRPFIADCQVWLIPSLSQQVNNTAK